MEEENASEQNSSDQNKQNTLMNEYWANVFSYIKEEMPDMDPSVSSTGSSSISKDCLESASQANNEQTSVGCSDLKKSRFLYTVGFQFMGLSSVQVFFRKKPISWKGPISW